MMRKLFFTISAIAGLCVALQAQNIAFRMGVGLGFDLGVRINRNVPQDHVLNYINAATPTLNVFTSISYKDFNFTPEFKISYATIGKGKRKASNVLGSSVPEGEYLSLNHAGSFVETIDRSPYLMNESDVTLQTMSVGGIVTYSFLKSGIGYVESGIGAFYFRKQVSFKDYLASDRYDYYGSAGSHDSYLQTDEYMFTETNREKNPVHTDRMLTHHFMIPLRVQYNFRTGNLIEISPSFTTFFGRDLYYNLNLAVTFCAGKQY